VVAAVAGERTDVPGAVVAGSVEGEVASSSLGSSVGTSNACSARRYCEGDGPNA